MFLLSNICRLSSKDRDKIVKLGGGYIIAKFGHKIPTGKLTDAQMIYDYLGSIEGFITIFQVNSVHKLPSNTLVVLC